MSEQLAFFAPEVPPPPRLADEAVGRAFAIFWERYPRKVGKLAAQTEFAKAVKRATPDEIMAGLARYEFSPNPKYIKHPRGWLAEGRYLDDRLDLAEDAWGIAAAVAAMPPCDTLSIAAYDREALDPIMLRTGWPATWRGPLDVLNAWLRDGYLPDSVASVIDAEVRQSGQRATLKAFDACVRWRAQKIGGF